MRNRRKKKDNILSLKPTVWLDASRNLTVDGSYRVSEWRSCSGGYKVSQATGASQPLLCDGNGTENRILQSENLGITWSPTRATAFASATLIEDATASNTHSIKQENIPVSAGEPLELSVSLKRGAGSRNVLVAITWPDASLSYAYVNLANGTLTSVTGSTTPWTGTPTVEIVPGSNIENMIRPSPHITLTGMVQSGASIVDVSPSDWLGLFSKAISLPDNSVTRYAYTTYAVPLESSIKHRESIVFSFYVRKDDGTAPLVGSDFRITSSGSYRVSGNIIDNLGDGLYRVTCAPYSDFATNQFYGVVKATTNSAVPIQVQGYQIRAYTSSSSYISTPDSLPIYRDAPDASFFRFSGLVTCPASGNATVRFFLVKDDTTISYNGDNASSIHIMRVSFKSATARSDYVKRLTTPQRQGINGNPALFFDGGDYLESATAMSSFFSASDKTIFAITSPLEINTTRPQCLLASSTSQSIDASINTSSSIVLTNNDGSVITSEALALTQNSPNLLILQQRGGAIRLWVNGVSAGAGIATSDTLNLDQVLRIGLDHSGANYFGGSIGEIITFNRAVRPFETEIVLDYLEDKWFGYSLKTDTMDISRPLPIGLPGLTYWLDGSNTASITSDANGVSSWANLALINTDGPFVQATNANKPWKTQSDNTENRIINSRNNTGPGGRYVDRLTANDNTADTTDPWGGNDATKLMETTDSGTHYVAFSWNVVSGRTYRCRMYLKDNGRGYARFAWDANNVYFNNTAWIVVNLTTGAVNATGGGLASYSVTDAGSGWWLLNTTAVAKATTAPAWVSSINTCKSDNSYSYAGDITKGIFIDQVTICDSLADDVDVTTTTSKYYRGVNGRTAIGLINAISKMTSTKLLSDIVTANAKTFFIVVRPEISTSGVFFLSGTKSYINLNERAGKATLWNYDTGWFDGNTPSGLTADSTHIIMFTHDGANIIAKLNGGAGTTTASGITSDLTASLSLGHASAGAISTVCEILTFNRVLAASEQTQVYNYLTTKWK